MALKPFSCVYTANHFHLFYTPKGSLANPPTPDNCPGIEKMSLQPRTEEEFGDEAPEFQIVSDPHFIKLFKLKLVKLVKLVK